jgi:hypothetical protein
MQHGAGLQVHPAAMVYNLRRLDGGRVCPHHAQGSGRGEFRAHLALKLPKARSTELCALSGASAHTSH